MKSLNTYVTEALSVKLDTVKLRKTKDMLEIYTKLTTVFSKLKTVLNNEACSISNKTDMKDLYNAMIDCYGDPRKLVASEWYKNNIHVNNPSSLAEFLKENRQFFADNKFDLSMINYDSKKLMERHKRYVKSDEYIPIRIHDSKKYKPTEGEINDSIRLFLIYDVNDPSNPDTTYECDYPYKINSDKHISDIKYDWHLQTGLSYYAARPILAYHYYKAGKNKKDLDKYVISSKDEDMD